MRAQVWYSFVVMIEEPPRRWVNVHRVAAARRCLSIYNCEIGECCFFLYAVQIQPHRLSGWWLASFTTAKLSLVEARDELEDDEKLLNLCLWVERIFCKEVTYMIGSFSCHNSSLSLQKKKQERKFKRTPAPWKVFRALLKTTDQESSKL